MLIDLIRSMRPRQWPKNAFVFVALLFDRKFFDPASVWPTVGAFVLLCLMSGAVYLMNDLADIESDRRHPTKRHRPLPSGRLNPRVAGVAVIDVERFSPWLYIFGGFLALFMALGKRRHELVLLGGEAANHRAILDDYNLDLIDRLQGVVTTSAVVSYSLYTFLAEGLPDNHAMMLTIPFVLYGIFRYLYLIHIRTEGGAPEEILLRDRPFQVNLLFYGLTVFVALYLLA